MKNIKEMPHFIWQEVENRFGIDWNATQYDLCKSMRFDQVNQCFTNFWSKGKPGSKCKYHGTHSKISKPVYVNVMK